MIRYFQVKFCKKWFLITVIFFLSIYSFAQNSAEFLEFKESYPNAQVLRLQNEAVVTLSLNKGNINVTQEILEENFYMDESATMGSEKSLNFSSFFKLEKIEASTFVPQGNKFKELKVTNYTEKDELTNSFYDDTRSVNFIFPNLQKGGKTRLNYVEKIKNPRFLSRFFLGDFFPVVNSKLTIIADKDINMSFRQFNTEGLDIKYNESSKGNNRIYTWEVNDVKEYKDEENTPTYTKIIPHACYLRSWFLLLVSHSRGKI